MKLAALVAVPALLASLAVGCADPSSTDDTGASEANATAATRVDGIAACAGKKACTNAFVVKALMNSQLKLTEMFAGEEPMSLASEYFIDWMQAGNETYSTFGIETKALGGGKYTVHISLGNHDLGEGGTESGCGFDFTLDHDTIVEREVTAFCAG